MGTTATSQSSEIKKGNQELAKQFLVYDVSDRVTQVYTAGAGTRDGGDCELTEYTYRSPASTQIEKRRESIGTWLAAYDM